MIKLKIEIHSDIASDGSIYYTATFPAVKSCVGGGDTPEEAIKTAKENLKVYLEYLAEEGLPIPYVGSYEILSV